MLNKKIASEIAIGTILLLAIAVGGIFWLQTKKVQVLNLQQALNKSKSETSQENKIQEAESSIANWKTYKNEKYDYSFKYPSFFDSVDVVDNEDMLRLDYKKNDVDIYLQIVTGLKSNKEKDDKGLMERNWQKGSLLNDKGEPMDVLFVDYNKYASQKNSRCQLYYASDIPVAASKNMIFISYFVSQESDNCNIYDKANYEGYLDIFKKINSNFIFENKETETWQTYKNDKYGFTFDYPMDFNARADSEPDPSTVKDNDIVIYLSIDKFKPLSEEESHVYKIVGPSFNLRMTKISENNLNKFSSEWVAKFRSGGGGVVDPKSLIKIENSMLAGLPAKQFHFDGSNMIIASVKTIKNGYLYELNFNSDLDMNKKEIDDGKRIFDQIVSTFKFIK